VEIIAEFFIQLLFFVLLCYLMLELMRKLEKGPMAGDKKNFEFKKAHDVK
jgi:hypothetical protein